MKPLLENLNSGKIYYFNQGYYNISEAYYTYEPDDESDVSDDDESDDDESDDDESDDDESDDDDDDDDEN